MGSRSGRVSCAGCDRWWKYVNRQPADLQQVVEPVPPAPASSRTTALRSRFVTSAPAGPGFPGTRPSPSGRATSSVSSCSRVGFGLGLDFAPLGLPLGFGLNASRATGTRYSPAPTAAGRGDARYPVPGHDLGHAQAVLDVVPRRRDLRLSHNACCQLVPMTASPPLDLYSSPFFHQSARASQTDGRGVCPRRPQ